MFIFELCHPNNKNKKNNYYVRDMTQQVTNAEHYFTGMENYEHNFVLQSKSCPS